MKNLTDGPLKTCQLPHYREVENFMFILFSFSFAAVSMFFPHQSAIQLDLTSAPKWNSSLSALFSPQTFCKFLLGKCLGIFKIFFLFFEPCEIFCVQIFYKVFANLNAFLSKKFANNFFEVASQPWVTPSNGWDLDSSFLKMFMNHDDRVGR